MDAQGKQWRRSIAGGIAANLDYNLLLSCDCMGLGGTVVWLSTASWLSRTRNKREQNTEVWMMGALTNEKCVACRRESPLVTEAEMEELKPQVPDWTVVEHEGVQQLQRVFKFGDFAQALNFTNRVGALAETEGHHPAILTEWGRVTVNLWTHKIHGLHRNDFIMAAKIDAFAPER